MANDSAGNSRIAAVVQGIGWGLLAIWAVASTLHPGTPIEEALTPIPMLYVVFAIIHGWLGFGTKGAPLMVLACFLIAFGFEASSIHNGFPFGFYEHGDVFGAKILEVPPFIPFGYFAITYPAWMLARIIVGDGDGGSDNKGGRSRALLWIPILTALIATGFDAAGDAVGATVHGYWLYRSPTGIFGVPLTNYFGWLLTCWTIGLAFSLIAPRFDRTPPRAALGFWAQLPLFWAIMALQFVIVWLRPAARAAETVLRGGRTWFVADVYEGAATVAILVMLPPAIIAFARLGLFAGRNGAR